MHTRGHLIVNADDWGRTAETTDRILECYERRCISSVSAMVFMADSERAGALAQEHGIDAGLHLNFTTPFSGNGHSTILREHQHRIARRLRQHRFAPVVFYPDLVNAFQYVISAQVDQFARLYGDAPRRVDGHHHMHQCANVVVGRLLQAGIIVRRNFSFEHREKGFANRLYRRAVDHLLSRRYVLTDFLFSLTPLAPIERLDRIFSLSRRFVVEVETHPVNEEEYRFLTSANFSEGSGYEIASCFRVNTNGTR